ncbi:MAG: hypothetical protein E7166_02060 [Firmicutes bacterium]|nr:hypothetical protein [Bacillota bacterium]
MKDKRSIYSFLKEFKRKYPFTISWRLYQNSKVIEQHINSDEKVIYAFAAQKNDNPFDIVTTCVVAITNKRILIGQKRVLFGYFYYSITPDMFNDLSIQMGLLWGKVCIDTVKEEIYLSNIQKEALIEIETQISELMMEEKKKYEYKNTKRGNN